MRTIHSLIPLFVSLSLSTLLLGGCNDKPQDQPPPVQTAAIPKPAPKPEAEAPKPAPAPAASGAPAPAGSVGTTAPSGKKVEIELASVGNTMAFDKTALTVPAGAQVHLVFKNNAPPGPLDHNFVLVKVGTEAKVAADGLMKGAAADYLAPGPDVLAFTPMTKPGKTSEVTFTAPAAGAYPYICSFPGHYMLMKGTLTVTP